MLSKIITEAKLIKDAPKIPMATDTRTTILKNTAIAKFAKIPAEATQIVPFFLSRKFSGLYGTGFAQPIKKGAFVITKIKGNMTEPNGSKCFKGFKVSLPAYWAVLSPK